jgi:hypothetical protein
MTDLSELGGYLNRYFPSGHLSDQYSTRVNVHLHGVGKGYAVMHNGERSDDGAGSASISYPEYFNCSSMFLHVLDGSKVAVEDGVFHGMNGDVPVTIYGEDPQKAKAALATTLATMAELERDYGPYMHPRFLAHITNDEHGGMEYAGAARTSLDALEHEITHSWFGRGVHAANGRSGWVDEAIASWRDEGYPRAAALDPSAKPSNLSGFSDYQRKTTMNAYGWGATVLAELDLMLADRGGLKPVLADFYLRYRGQPVTTEQFLDFVQAASPTDLDEYFGWAVYGLPAGSPRPRGLEANT